MPDPYASITTADPVILERLVAALEVRGADLLNRGILQEFLSEIPFPEGARVLDIGCGTGAVTRVLAARPDVSETIGIDPSPVFIAKAMELAPRAGKLSFQEADGRALPLTDARFDVVIFHTTLCHVPKPEAALAEALRVLRPGGSVAVFDGDYATTTFATGNFDPLQCCADAAIDGLVHDRWLIRRLPTLLRSGGFEAPRCRSYGYTALPEPSYMFTLVDRGTDLLLAAGRIGPGMAEALKAEARRRAEANHFYGLIVFASAVARKSPSTGTR